MEADVAGTPSRLYTCAEVAEILGVGTDWVRRKTQTREVEHVRLGRNLRFTERQVAAIVAAYTAKAVPTTTARTRL